MVEKLQRTGGSPRLPHAAAEFDRPVLLVAGTGNQTWLRQIIDVPGEQLPRVRVIEMPAGHAPHLVSMEVFWMRLRRST